MGRVVEDCDLIVAALRSMRERIKHRFRYPLAIVSHGPSSEDETQWFCLTEENPASNGSSKKKYYPILGISELFVEMGKEGIAFQYVALGEEGDGIIRRELEKLRERKTSLDPKRRKAPVQQASLRAAQFSEL